MSDEWKPTGKTRKNARGYIEHEEESIEYYYGYDIYLVLMKVVYGTNGWLAAVGLGLGIAGMVASGPIGWAVGAGGVGLAIEDLLISGRDYVPLGLQFELIEKDEVWRKKRWVE